MTTKELGDLGEKLACEYLVGKGYNILGKNDKIFFGEIDIIARKKSRFFAGLLGRGDKTLHFIEVKALRSQNPQIIYPEDHVNYKKQRKLRHLAHIWLKKNHYKSDYPYQIDVIGIVINEVTRNAKLHYFPNAIKEK